MRNIYEGCDQTFLPERIALRHPSCAIQPPRHECKSDKSRWWLGVNEARARGTSTARHMLFSSLLNSKFWHMHPVAPRPLDQPVGSRLACRRTWDDREPGVSDGLGGCLARGLATTGTATWRRRGMFTWQHVLRIVGVAADDLEER